MILTIESEICCLFCSLLALFFATERLMKTIRRSHDKCLSVFCFERSYLISMLEAQACLLLLYSMPLQVSITLTVYFVFVNLRMVKNRLTNSENGNGVIPKLKVDAGDAKIKADMLAYEIHTKT